MKLYVIDDNLIISGANLSDTYFTNRQDRYVLIRDSPNLCNYFDDLIKTISNFSMHLNANGEFSLNPNWDHDPRKYSHRKRFLVDARNQVKHLNDKYCSLVEDFQTKSKDSLVCPLLNMKSLGINDEEKFTTNLLKNNPLRSTLKIATGYFNLTSKYQKIICSRPNKYPISILMASEQANGFHNGSGILRYIPLIYTYYLGKFLKLIRNDDSLSLFYYDRPGWSFHAKGIWASNREYYLTLVGSTNFGYRSVYRDNEAQIIIATSDKQLSQAFDQEYQDLLSQSRPVKSSQDLPLVPFWVRTIAALFRSYF